VSGRITLKLVEVPWDQALELILKTNKLGYAVEGNVIRIAPLAELAAEEADRRRLAEEKALAGDLFTQTRVLSYSKASEIQELLQRNLSPRGDIVIDERTNTVIYTDLAEQVASINQLIDTLDTRFPGRDQAAIIGHATFAGSSACSGAHQQPDQTLRNTTELVFPTSKLDGQAIGRRAPVQRPAGRRASRRGDEGADPVQRGYAVNLPFAGAPTGAVGLSLGSISGAFSIDAAISAAERRGQVRIISAPKIITQNNKAAEIKQGVTFPVQVVANNTITVQFKDAVLDLSVTPQITSADTIISTSEINNDTIDFRTRSTVPISAL
jgi:type IV pilus assembly protein PilQ